MLLLTPLALATSGFDPATPAARYEGEQIYTADGEILLWSAIELLEDADDTLMVQEEFTDAIAWPEDADYAPFIADCFGTTTPASSSFLLHMGLNEANATGTPILMVPGAGDNASRGFITMAHRLNNNTGRPVYALTFAHPHGDVFRHAEAIADAIARIQARTGATQVDLISHSKGGIAAAVYLSNHESASWSRTDYTAVGTRYRGDVRKAVFIAVPLGGIDTGFRWPLGSLASLETQEALSPSAWSAFYPAGTATWWNSTDLTGQDFLAPGGDPFPGHRQLLARWDDIYPLPGGNADLGAYSAQLDWYTTYHGGTGFYTQSDGIDAVIAAGDDVLGSLRRNGVASDVRLYLMAGDNPMMPNGLEDYLEETFAEGWTADFFGESWVDLSIAGTEVWGALVAELVADSVLAGELSEVELTALAQGKLLLGEVSGPSDGLVFVDSALMSQTLTGAGAEVIDAHTFDLSHLDLLYASDVTGALLMEAAEADAVSDGWMAGVGERYAAENSLAWVEEALAEDDAPSGGDTGDTGISSDTGDTDDTGAALEGQPEVTRGGCGACSSGGGPASGLAVLAVGLLGLIRRR
jgi:triacylglycerol lipase